MNTLYDQLIIEEGVLREQIRLLKERMNSYPEGILEISYSHGHVQYYWRNRSSGGKRAKRVYIRKNDRNLAASYAQRDYDHRLMDELQQRLDAVTAARTAYGNTSPEKTIQTFKQEKQSLICPLILTDSQFACEWQAQEYKGKPFAGETPGIFTVKGERVRSKSEKIIADALERRGIPYKYEAPLILQDGAAVYPDFSVLNVRRRKEYIWEHLGMMDNEEYARSAVAKLNSYINSGIFPGERLIITMESQKTPLGTKTIEMMIERYLS